MDDIVSQLTPTSTALIYRNPKIRQGKIPVLYKDSKANYTWVACFCFWETFQTSISTTTKEHKCFAKLSQSWHR